MNPVAEAARNGRKTAGTPASATTAAEPIANVVRLPLRDVRRDDAWNARSGAWWNDGGGTGESRTGFGGLRISIREKGQDAPIIVRPDPKGTRPWLVVDGHRRHRAVEENAAEAGAEETAEILAIIVPCDEAEARAINARSGTTAEPHKEADVAWAVSELATIGVPAETIAKQMGLAVPYVAVLTTIGRKCCAQVRRRWRADPREVRCESLLAIANAAEQESLQADEQVAMYERLATDPKARAEARESAKDKGMKVRAARFGAILGKLAAAKLWRSADPGLDETCAIVIGNGMPAHGRRRDAIVAAMAEAFDSKKSTLATKKGKAET